MRTRRALLLACSVTAAYVGGLIPSRFVIFGAEFSGLDHGKISIGAVFVILYLALEFLVLSRRNYLTAIAALDAGKSLSDPDMRLGYDFNTVSVPVFSFRRRGPARFKRIERSLLAEATTESKALGQLTKPLPLCKRVALPLPVYGFQAFLDYWFPILLSIAAIVALLFFPPDPGAASYSGEGT